MIFFEIKLSLLLLLSNYHPIFHLRDIHKLLAKKTGNNPVLIIYLPELM